MKKINIGIILIMITLISMVCYLIYKENIKKQDIENIKSFLEDYYKVYNKYSLLYEEDRDIDKIIDKSKYDEYKENMKSDLDKYIVQDSSIKQNIFNQYLTRIDEQIKGKYIYNKHEKTPDYNFPQIYFDGEYVFLLQNIVFEVDKVDRNFEIYNKETEKFEGETTTHIGTDKTCEYIVMKKENEEYKILTHMMIDSTHFLFEYGYI